MEGAREKIMEVATKLFAEKGYAGVSIRELTIAANVNVSAISYYYGGKEGLYCEIIKQQLSWTEKILEIVHSKTNLSPVERLKLYMQMHTDVRANSPLVGKFMNSEMSNPTDTVGPIIMAHIDKVSNMIFSLIKEGMEKGYFMNNLNPAYCAVTLTGILNFYFHAEPFVSKLSASEQYKDAEYLPRNLDSKTYINHAMEIFFHGISKKK